ncbi:O-acetyl-ADP-ribose deacetylase [Plebeiibacterium sediminum]|uniref:O-acetyl-ADP-ribose deacetylase n=1 Tax=Plebeiibacterium sediminum TaxID=2992112 RepID=A0AAE3M121_9BACT|nr:O-acetyl-ADP-ribose deacetylase [Plebeiobacterium sediminum]MCW3785227.1 O-acetyl-ADP-ribose deacetylase [Plebeiobacterium sediminum]
MKIELIKGDITRLNVDAIVNAANSSLLGGGGVDGAIHRAGGKSIVDECILIRNKQGGCPSGEAVITTAGNMPAKYVIHTVGPIYKNGKHDEAKLLANCYINSLLLAAKNNCKSIAFPNISTGVYGYPKAEAATIAFNAVSEYKNSKIEQVIFVCYDDENYNLYKELMHAD